MIDESKNVQTTPTRTYCKHNRPLPYCHPNCRTPRHWKFTQYHRTTRPPEGGAMVLGKLPVPGRPTIWITVGQGPTALARSGWGLLRYFYSHLSRGWSGGAMVLGKLPVPGRPTIWISVGQGPTALAVGAGGVVWTFLLSSILSLLFLPLFLFGRRPDIDCNTVSKGR